MVAMMRPRRRILMNTRRILVLWSGTQFRCEYTGPGEDVVFCRSSSTNSNFTLVLKGMQEASAWPARSKIIHMW